MSLTLNAQANGSKPLVIVTLADSTRGHKSTVDIGPPGPSLGDLFVFDQPLMDEHRRDIGSNSGYCINTLPGVHSQCQWTLLMDGGTIVVAGQEQEVGRSVVAVIGATGKYIGYTGEMTSEPNADGTFTQTLTLYRRHSE
ncbi:allene oxide cyclase barrel-like domain-containing protein [Dyella nitratireducens]|nr:hypothetical protein [Dyella nitratireducens]